MPNNPTTSSRRSAHLAVAKAVRNGTLHKPTLCEECSELRPPVELHAHHYLGYDEEHWLDVIFLCPKCHGKAHNGRSINWFTDEQSRRGGVTTAANTTYEERVARSRRGVEASRAKLTHEDRVELGRRGGHALAAKTTHEERSANSRRGWDVRRQRETPEEISRKSRRSIAAVTPEGRARTAAAVKEYWEKRGSAARTARAKKAAAARWANVKDTKSP